MLPVSDKTVWDLFFSQFYLAVVSVADEIGLFSAINDGSIEAKKLAESVSLSIRGVESLCLALRALDLLNNEMDSLSEVGKTYFIASSPYYWGAILQAYQKNETHQRILAGLRQQRDLELDGQSLTKMWKSGDISSAAAESFTAKMDAMGTAPAAHAVKTEAFSGLDSLLDVGGGSGVFSRAFLSQNSKGQATVFDLAEVVNEAKSYQQRLAPKQNMHFIVGNFFEIDWPQQQQAILLANILHDWPLTEGRALLEKAYASLQVGGRLIIHEMLFDDENTSEKNTAFFDLLMFVNHGSQQYKKNQLMQLMCDLGFNTVSYCQGSACYGLIYAEK